ncbi:MAG: helicase [Gemmataceae bacterium]|nr:helicase [Gemmataceae bacterium]
MPHFPKPFFKKGRGVWYVEIDHTQHNLGSDKDAAFERNHELMRERPHEADLSLALGVMDAFLTWAKDNKADRTFEWYQRHLKTFSKSIPPLLATGQIKKHHLTACLQAAKTLNGTTQNGLCRAVVRAFRWAENEEIIQRSPFRGVEKPRNKRRTVIISDDEYAFLLSRIPAETRGAQMIFCDLGVHPTPWGYSAYDDTIAKLIARGIPREQIAAIGEADSDAKKQSLFEKVRTGQVRVLLGSTQKMGTGTNVQKRLVALHHLDAPWKPAEVEQREGRILRQGNENEEVAIYRYVTTGSFDSFMWVRRASRSIDGVAWPRGLNHTCGSVRSSLPTPARAVRPGWEAVGTTYPDPLGSRTTPRGVLCPASTAAGVGPGLVA